MPEVATVLQMRRSWPQTIGIWNQRESQQGSIGQSNQKKTRAKVARSNEDGEEAFTCVNVKKLRSSGNSKKSNSNQSTSEDEAIYSAVCCAQSNDGQIYIEVGNLNGRPVKIL